jgi:hypothetical protein
MASARDKSWVDISALADRESSSRSAQLRRTPLYALSDILEKSPYLSIPTMKVNAGFGFSDGMVGVGVASGVGMGAGPDLRTRRPDCATTANAHKNSNVAHKLA